MTKICYYGDKISPHISKTPEGFLICQNVPIARTGYQQYLDSELKEDGDPDTIVDVYRSPDEVFSRATLASFEGKPVTNNHPDVDVTPNNYDSLACGHVQHVRIGSGGDSDKIVADLYITDPDLIEAITNGKREVSAGYYAEDQVDGKGRICQVKIRGNHVAVVDSGRAGHTVCIRDSQINKKRGEKKMKISLLKKMRRYLLDAEPEELNERLSKVSTMLDGEDEFDVDVYTDADDWSVDEIDMIEDEDDTDMIEDEDDLDMIEDEDDLDMIEDEDDLDMIEDEDDTDMIEDEDDTDIIEDEDDLDMVEDEDDVNDVIEDEDDLISVDPFNAPIETKDAALKKLQKVASKITNRRDRAMMQSAIISAKGHKSQMPAVMKHVRNAQAKRDSGCSMMNIERQQNIYDKMNPHKK